MVFDSSYTKIAKGEANRLARETIDRIKRKREELISKTVSYHQSVNMQWNTTIFGWLWKMPTIYSDVLNSLENDLNNWAIPMHKSHGSDVILECEKIISLAAAPSRLGSTESDDFIWLSSDHARMLIHN